MTNDWVRERAEFVRKWSHRQLHHYGMTTATRQDIGALQAEAATALQEAIERGQQSILDRLNNPDEAMVEKVRDACGSQDGCAPSRDAIMVTCDALAAELGKNKETER